MCLFGVVFFRDAERAVIFGEEIHHFVGDVLCLGVAHADGDGAVGVFGGQRLVKGGEQEVALVADRHNKTVFVLRVHLAVAVHIHGNTLDEGVHVVVGPVAVLYRFVEIRNVVLCCHVLVEKHTECGGEKGQREIAAREIELIVQGELIAQVAVPPRLLEIDVRHVEEVHKHAVGGKRGDEVRVSGNELIGIVSRHDRRTDRFLERRLVPPDARCRNLSDRDVEPVVHGSAPVVDRVVDDLTVQLIDVHFRPPLEVLAGVDRVGCAAKIEIFR